MGHDDSQRHEGRSKHDWEREDGPRADCCRTVGCSLDRQDERGVDESPLPDLDPPTGTRTAHHLHPWPDTWHDSHICPRRSLVAGVIAERHQIGDRTQTRLPLRSVARIGEIVEDVVGRRVDRDADICDSAPSGRRKVREGHVVEANASTTQGGAQRHHHASRITRRRSRTPASSTSPARSVPTFAEFDGRDTAR